MRPRHQALAAATAILLLAGCAQTEWVKSGASPAQQDADIAACKHDSGQDAFITVYRDDQALSDAHAQFRDCMKARGYTGRMQ